MKYIVRTNVRNILITVTDKALAEKFFEQSKEKYNNLMLLVEKEIPYTHNGKNTVKEVLKCWCKQGVDKTPDAMV